MGDLGRQGGQRALRRALLVVGLLAAGAPAALAWPGPPKTHPPKPPAPGAPPPAWIGTISKSAWLAFGSYCWKTSCVDMIPPETRPGLPSVTVSRARTVRVHLGFAAGTAMVAIDKKRVVAKLDATKRIVSWTAMRGGFLVVSARAAGSASYVARLSVG
jgi:hypothetical protein